MKLTRRGENVLSALKIAAIVACLLAAGWLEAHPSWPLG